MENKLKVEYVDIDTIKPYKNNAKLHPKEQIEQIKKSIENFGMNDPIGIWNNEIVEGHGRILACKELGYKQIPVIKLDHLTDEERKSYIIAHNKLTMNSDFDIDILRTELENLKELDFDLELTGFNVDELDDILGKNEEETEIVEDEVPEVPEEPKAKLGDIYQLGSHRLMCGDSTKEEDVAKLMNGVKADMVFTDPPYDMSMGGQGCFKSSMDNCKERIDNIINFDPYVISYLANMDIPTYYICTSKDGVPKYMDIFKEHNFNILVWCKTNPVPFTAGTFLPDIEYIMYFSKKGKKIWNNSLKPTDTYKKYYISKKLQGREDAGEDLHPTMKPLELISNKIRISSNENGIVLDIFGGSGSTLIACEQLNRKCYMMELDPHYIDVIIQRWENFTGKKAIKLN